MVRLIQETSFKELDKSTTEFTILIDSLDVWKFSRWLELIEAYDCSRKSSDLFDTLIREIMKDYDKDFKHEEDLW